MLTTRDFGRLVSVASLVLILALGWCSVAQAHVYGGRALGAFVNAPSLGAGSLYLADSGELAPSGGWTGAGLLSADVPNLLTASVVNAAASGAGDWGSSSSSLADVVLLPGQVAQVTASFVRAQAEATAAGGQGTIEISDLTFGGVPLPVTGQPNQTVQLPGLLGPLATLIINEQTATADSIAVNALRLVLATGEQIVVASARSRVDPQGNVTLASQQGDSACASNAGQAKKAIWRATEPPPIILTDGANHGCIDFVTGGGWFVDPDSNRPPGVRVNFGFNAGPRSAQNPDDLKGHLNFVDHGGPTSPRMHVKGINVMVYERWGSDMEHCRTFGGDAVVNGASGWTYIAVVCDYSEPGRDDRFQLQLFDPGGAPVYNADNRRESGACPAGEPECGVLDGGNIQLHKEKCAKTRARFTPVREGGPLTL
jgi:hypothetical protein